MDIDGFALTTYGSLAVTGLYAIVSGIKQLGDDENRGLPLNKTASTLAVILFVSILTYHTSGLGSSSVNKPVENQFETPTQLLDDKVIGFYPGNIAHDDVYSMID